MGDMVTHKCIASVAVFLSLMGIAWMCESTLRLQTHIGDCFWSIVLKKSASVSTVEKFAPEIEICVFGRRFTTRTSRSSTQNRCFYLSVSDRFGQTDFFNRIGRQLPFGLGSHCRKGDVTRALHHSTGGVQDAPD